VGVWKRLFEDAGGGLGARERFFERMGWAFWGCGRGFLRVRKRLFGGVKEALWRGGMGGTDCRDGANG